MRAYLGLDQGGWTTGLQRPTLPDELTGGRRGALRAVALVITLAGLVGAFLMFDAPVGYPLWASAAAIGGGLVLLRPRRRVTQGVGFALVVIDLVAVCGAPLPARDGPPSGTDRARSGPT